MSKRIFPDTKPRCLPWPWGLLFLLLAAPCWATLVPSMSLEELVEEANDIVHGKVIKTWAAWDKNSQFIWTHAELSVAESLKGRGGKTLIVSEPGGELEGTEMQIVGSPRYQPGEEVVVFLAATPVGYSRTCGWGQGKFVVASKAGGQRIEGPVMRGITLIEPASPGTKVAAPSTALGGLDGLELDEFKQKVKELIDGSR